MDIRHFAPPPTPDSRLFACVVLYETTRHYIGDPCDTRSKTAFIWLTPDKAGNYSENQIEDAITEQCPWYIEDHKFVWEYWHILDITEQNYRSREY